MAKIALVSADESHLQYLAGLIAQATSHVVQRTCATPAQALGQPGLAQGADLLILEAATFSADDIQQLRRLTTDRPDTLCMLLTENPSADLLMRAMRAGVQCVLPWPPDAHEFRDELQRCTSHALSGSRNEGQVLSFLSCKGGSGTTFTAANFAHVLSARHGKHVLLVDVCNQIDRLDASLLDTCVTHVSTNFDVLAGAGDPIKAGEIKAMHLERLLTLAASMYDVVVFDLGQDINPASILVLDHSSAIYAVLQLNLAYLRAGRRLMEICHSLGYRAERLKLIVNQYDKRVPFTQNTLESAFGMPVSHVLPYDPATVRDSVNQGRPVLDVAENSPISRALTDMARQLFPATQPQRDGLLRKLFGHANQVPAPVRA